MAINVYPVSYHATITYPFADGDFLLGADAGAGNGVLWVARNCASEIDIYRTDVEPVAAYDLTCTIVPDARFGLATINLTESGASRVIQHPSDDQWVRLEIGTALFVSFPSVDVTCDIEIQATGVGDGDDPLRRLTLYRGALVVQPDVLEVLV
jgi:hypothetical protein